MGLVGVACGAVGKLVVAVDGVLLIGSESGPSVELVWWGGSGWLRS